MLDLQTQGTKVKNNKWDYETEKSCMAREVGELRQNLQFIQNTKDSKKTEPACESTIQVNRHFWNDDTQMANKNMTKCSILLITMKMKIKSIMRYYLIPVRMNIIRKTKVTNAGKDVGKEKLFIIHY